LSFGRIVVAMSASDEAFHASACIADAANGPHLTLGAWDEWLDSTQSRNQAYATRRAPMTNAPAISRAILVLSDPQDESSDRAKAIRIKPAVKPSVQE
jgi:hypothetical protein